MEGQGGVAGVNMVAFKTSFSFFFFFKVHLSISTWVSVH